MHHKNIFGTHVNCDLQPHVGIICGSAAKSDSFSGNSHSSTAKSLQIKGGNFHNGDREKAISLSSWTEWSEVSLEFDRNFFETERAAPPKLWAAPRCIVSKYRTGKREVYRI